MNCPACHVAVPNGYARCPRCQHALPTTPRAQTSFGGTALEDRRFPVVPVAIGAIVMIAIIVFFATRGGGKREEPVVLPEAAPEVVQVAPAVAAPPPKVAAPAPTPRGPSPTAAADDLLKVLRRQRLWSTIDARAPRLDVRSQSCADPGMAAAIEAARPALRDAGLTVLRCLEESGRVVFQRDL